MEAQSSGVPSAPHPFFKVPPPSFQRAAALEKKPGNAIKYEALR